VTLLEKNTALGGSTARSVGSVTSSCTPQQANAGISDSPDEHFEDMGRCAGGLVSRDNTELRRVLVDNVPDTFRWLMALGVTFFGPLPEPPHRKPRMHIVLPNSHAYIDRLKRECRRLGVEFRLNAAARRLVVDSGRVIGVDATADGASHRFIARQGVVLATGDYSASRQIKQEYAPGVAGIEAVNRTNTGDGHLMGREIGSMILNGDLIAPNLRFAPPGRKSLMLRLPPVKPLAALMRAGMTYVPASLLRPFILSFLTTLLAPAALLYREGAILINTRGERFTDELHGPEFALSGQPDGCAFVVFDDRIARKFTRWPYFISTAPGVAYAYLPDYRRSRRDIYHEAHSLEALAVKMRVPPDGLTSAVARYNAAQTAAAPAVCGGLGGARPQVSEKPFYALGPVFSWIVLTDGGLRVSARHEVQRADCSVIPGLFAVGSVGQGGLLLEGHGHHLAWAFTSGRRAGRQVLEHGTA